MSVPDIQSRNSVHFSAAVVTFNDDRHLEKCLAALSFCDELIVVDLGSKDQSVQIAAEFGARIIQHEWVPAVEYVRQFAVNQAKHLWIVFMDPDMIFPTHLIPTIRAKIQQDPSLGMIGIPCRNYFLGKPVKHGRWGGNVAYPAVFHKDAMEIRSVAHRGFRVRPGFNRITLRGTEADVIKHYWVDSLDHLYQKHSRYIPLEGPARYVDGERFSYWWLLFGVPWAVFSSLFLRRGFLDGRMGVYLSFFNGWWTWKYLLSLRDHQRKLEKEGLARPGNGKLSRLLRMLYELFRPILQKAGYRLIRLESKPHQVSILNLAGDRDIEWSWIASQMPSGPGEALNFGPGGSYLALIAAQRGFNVTAVDLEPVRWYYLHPRLRFTQGDILRLSLPEEHFDLVINCSTVEHVGLARRYGVTEDCPDGDLEAMASLHSLLKPGGVMLLTIPIGRDTVFAPLHRVYGTKRLPKLLNGYVVEKKEYWLKDDQNRWVLAHEEEALDRRPQRSRYGLGCFVLRKEEDFRC